MHNFNMITQAEKNSVFFESSGLPAALRGRIYKRKGDDFKGLGKIELDSLFTVLRHSTRPPSRIYCKHLCRNENAE